MMARARKMVGRLQQAIAGNSAPVGLLEDAADLIVDLSQPHAAGATDDDIQFELNAALEFGDTDRAERLERIKTALTSTQAALRRIAEGNLGDEPWQADYDKIRAVARAALSSQGRSDG